MADGHVYDSGFFDYISVGARKSAEIVSREVAEIMGPRLTSVLDVGCGQGVWTRTFAEIGTVTEVRGVDGAYVQPEELVIDPADFTPHDLTQPLDLNRSFSLAVCLEVGEHLPPSAGPTLVAALTDHAPVILFSAAIPGQGGEHHVNERPLDYWKGLFHAAGFDAYDCIRPKVNGHEEIEPWYRYNSVLYLKRGHDAELEEILKAHLVPDGVGLSNPAPMSWKLRCAVLRQLPRPLIEVLAQIKHRVVRLRNRTA